MSARNETVRMAHGGGGVAMRRLIDEVFLPHFQGPHLESEHDGATLDLQGATAFTTDSYVVRPLFFPGGDIGSLAVFGTVNDLAMCGARPRFLSAGFILEEGVPFETLERIARSMGEAAKRAGIAIVTGDTKVVDRGAADGVFINTAGVGSILTPQPVSPKRVRAGDAVILSGDLGRHGIAILSSREGLAFETALESDLAPLNGLVEGLVDAKVDVHCLRDLTRGGFAAAVNEIACVADCTVQLDEAAIPVCEAVEGACELLGLDPLYVANEGRLVAFVAPEQAERAVQAMRRSAPGSDARVVGVVDARGPAPVVLRTHIWSRRVLDPPSGELLPRIC